MAEGAIGVTATCAADRAGAAHAEATTSATGDSRCSSAPGRARNADFLRRKEQILASLDRSPKGSLDAPITELLAWLNAQSSVVTTSSCSGRISVFLGASDPSSSKGGQWLLISHEALGDATATWARVTEDLQRRSGTAGEGLRGTLASLLLEPFVLHAECADADTAQRILEAARETGFRESGISLGRRRVMVQVRTLALRLEVPLALDGRLLTEEAHFQTLVHLANERLAENARRVERLWARLREALRTAAAEAAAAAAPAETPWILVCPQPMARAVKLAVEERSWMDEGRKMAPFTTDATADGPSCIGIPVTDAAVDALQELPELPDTVGLADAAIHESGISERGAEGGGDGHPQEASVGASKAEATVPASMAAPMPPPLADQGPNPVEQPSRTRAVGGKSSRPVTVAADLLALWRRSRGTDGPLRLLQSDALPRKERPVQHGTPGGAAASATVKERESLEQVVSRVHSKVAEDVGAEILPELLADVQAMGPLQWRGDVALLPRGMLSGSCWGRLAAAGGLWEEARAALGARLLARQQEIRVDDEVRGGAIEVLAGSGDGWVTVPGPLGVRYAFDVTRCMFSEGNAAERTRVATWAVQGQTILDLYAGIGFWTLPLLAAGAERVLACEWNPHALEALRRGLQLLGEDAAGRCDVLAGDNRRPEVREAAAGRCHRVVLGLIPTSRDGFPAAVTALREEGGMLHVHWNVPGSEEAIVAQAIASELQELLRAERGGDWHCSVVGVQRIKWYAPRIRHVRIDVRCQRGTAE